MLAHPAVLVFVGGGLGAVLRWAVGTWAAGRGLTFPWHTFAVNVAGSFALGVLAATCANRPAWLLFAGVGVCGGFTTFSTFSVETVRLIGADRPAAAAGYAVGSVLAAVFGAWAGMRLCRGASL